MVVKLEKKIPKEGTRGPSKFMAKLIPALRRIGVQFSSMNATVILCTQSWKQGRLKIPRVIRVDGAWHRPKKNVKYTKRILRSQVTVWQSNFCKEYSSKILGVPPVGSVIYNGENPKIFNRFDRINCDGKKHVYVCANWMTRRKKHRKIKRLIDTINIAKEYTRHHKDVIFWIVGDTGHVRSECPNIKFWGRVNHQQLVNLIMASNVMLDLEWFAWCPNTVVEALVGGLPVIAMNNGGAAELVKQGWGEILKLDPAPNIRDYRFKKVPQLRYDPVYAALDRWINCEEKKPAKKLFIDNIARQYADVLKRASL